MAETETTETITFRVPEELKQQLEDHIWELKTQGEIPRNQSRSEFLRSLLQDELREE